MGILDRFFGQDRPSGARDTQGAPQALTDEQALQRYRYFVRTAPPEAIEEAHREAFARLTPEQRQQALKEMNAAAPPNERIDDRAGAEPQSLARMATRAELRQPGTMERSLGGPGLGGMFASSLMGSVVGSVLGSAIAHQMFGGFPHGGPAADEAAPSDATASDEGASGGADGNADASGGDSGGDFADDGGGGFGDDLGSSDF